MNHTIIITGANSGLGFACSKHIARTSPEYQIILVCRDAKKAEQAKTDIIKETGNPNIIAMELNLSSLKSVRTFTDSVVSAQLPPIYGIVCNAGINSGNSGLTEDGFEPIFGVNHLAHFFLTNLLLPHMNPQGRIAVVSSDMHNPPQGLTWPGVKELIYPSPDFNGNRYCLSKLCNLYFTYELAGKFEQSGQQIAVNAFNPGLMTETNLFGGKNHFTESFLQSIADRVGSLENSSKALADMITDTSYEHITGKYIDRGKEIPSSPLSYNTGNAKELWDASAELVKQY